MADARVRVKGDKMGTEIRKPLSVLRAEFISQLTELINASSLPPFIIEPILKDLYNDIKILSQKQLETDIRTYEEAKQKLMNSQQKCE